MNVPIAKKGLMRSDDCFCSRCWKPGEAGPLGYPMFLCPDCGNKRCPKATFHEHPCSNSNEPGQPGSDYA